MSYYERNREMCKQKALERYHANRDEINEKQKLYFRETYYRFCNKYRDIQRKNIITKKYGLEYYKIIKNI
jgi:hypothetical protein